MEEALKPADYISLAGIVITAVVALVSAVIGAVVGARIAGKYSLEATEKLLAAERQLRKEEGETKIRALLSAYFHELSIVWDVYKSGFGAQIETVAEGEALQVAASVGANLFVIYDGNAASIGLIPNAALRNNIVEAYTRLKELNAAILLHNQLNNELVQAAKNSRAYTDLMFIQRGSEQSSAKNMAASLHQSALNALRAYTTVLKGIHSKTEESVVRLIAALEPYAES